MCLEQKMSKSVTDENSRSSEGVLIPSVQGRQFHLVTQARYLSEMFVMRNHQLTFVGCWTCWYHMKIIIFRVQTPVASV